MGLNHLYPVLQECSFHSLIFEGLAANGSLLSQRMDLGPLESGQEHLRREMTLSDFVLTKWYSIAVLDFRYLCLNKM